MKQKARTELAEGTEEHGEEHPLSTGATHLLMTARGRWGAGQDTEKGPAWLHSARTLLLVRDGMITAPYTPVPGKALNQNRIHVLCAQTLWSLRSTTQKENYLIIFTSLGSGRTGASQEPSESDWEGIMCRGKQTTYSLWAWQTIQVISFNHHTHVKGLFGCPTGPGNRLPYHFQWQ